ncbi:MAG TPA: porin, partial [Polyangium sp.]|nr:porin [Polyangium sp.]
MKSEETEQVDDHVSRIGSPKIKIVFLGCSLALSTVGASREVHAEAAKPAQNTIKVTGEPGKGLTVDAGERFSLNLRSRIQIRYQLNVPPADDQGERDEQQTVSIGTARLWLSGHILSRKLTYMTQLAVAGRDFRDDARSPIFDAYLDWKVHRDFNIRAGQYFVPFDRLRTVREFALQMADRPAPVNEFTLDRDVGVTFYSDTFLSKRSPVAWRVGFFGGGGTNLTTSKEGGGLFVGRLELR